MTSSQTHSILVAGCQGQVGRELLVRGSAHGFSLIGLDLPDVDISDAPSVQRAVEAHKPDLVINAAAYTAVDKAESEAEQAFAVNVDGPRHLAEACASAQIPLFHISTDYVYDGAKSTPYREDDPIVPLGVYGRTKAEGDEAVRRALKSHIILRTAWVYSSFGGNFVKTMLRLATEHDQLTVVDDQHGCPTAAGDIADTLLTLARLHFDEPAAMADKWGTYQYCSSPATTWCGFAQAIVAKSVVRGGRNVPVLPIATADYPTPARRPVNSVLDCSKIEKTFGVQVRAWSDALDETLDQLMASDKTEGTHS